MMENNEYTKDELNRMAYMDVLDCKPPQRSEKEYMDAFNWWRPLQKYPGDEDWYDYYNDNKEYDYIMMW